MTTTSKLVQVRMPQRLVQVLDRLSAEGIYSSRSEAIIDGVRRLVLAYEVEDPFKKALLKSYMGKTVQGSVEDLRNILDPQDIMSGITEAFGTDCIDDIITEVRR
jgi:Arc/MetJ-type ribon-helix-helix transcriptional regulator